MFKVKDKWWTAAINIEKGDYLYSENNEYLQVEDVKVEKNSYPSYVYNLSIGENHNYFVGEEQVLVHNMANMKSCSQSIEGVGKADKLKISSWKYAPDEELYLKYKDVFDNPKYYNQTTGEINWPGQHGDKNIDGFLNGKFDEVTLKPGEIIDRYGSGYGLSLHQKEYLMVREH